MERAKQILGDVLGGIANSCDAFDRGDKFEAIRIGTAVRVLLHQTKSSTSLLTHLGSPPLRLLNTSGPVMPKDSTVMLTSLCLITMTFGPGGHSLKIRAPLQEASYASFLPWQAWWDQLVLALEPHKVTRKDIVLTAANKDGGAHVDEKVPDWYALLQGGFIVGVSRETAGQRTKEQHLAMLRQIGFEILNSPELLALR